MLGSSFSHYRILEKLGQGGMGVVYLAEDTVLGRRVAVKFPAVGAAYRQRLLAEARAASSLNHPNIAAIYDCGELEDSPYVVMELVEGRGLDELLRAGPLGVERSVTVVKQVAEALAEAHARHLIHRDIKPSNIRINERGVVKVVDFGLAKNLRERQVPADASPTLATTRTLEGAVSGTPRYMSPEQARGESGDERSDLFSLGVVLYECLTGRSAFQGDTGMDVLAQVLQSEPPPPSTANAAVPLHLDQVAARAMAKQPAQRYQSAEEMLRDLAVPPVAPARRLALRLALAGLGIAVIAVALLWWFHTRSGYRPPPEALRWYQEGTAAIGDATYFKASKALERAAGLDPRFPLAHARLAEAYNELDDTSRAQQELLKATSPSGAPRLARRDELTLEAIYRTLTRDFSGAIRDYREILRLAPENARSGFWLDLGRAYEKAEQPKDAMAAYQEAARRSPQYPAAFLRLGMLYGRSRDRANAIAAFDQAASLYGALSNIEGVAEVLYQRALLESQLGNLDGCESLFQKALGMARTAGNEHQQISVMLQMGELDYRKGDTAAAERHVEAALELARSRGLELQAIRGLLSLGNAYFVRGEMAQAETHFRQALAYAQRAKAERSQARALISLGSLHIQQSRLEEGIREVEQALPFYRRGGYSKEISLGLILLGRAQRAHGDYAAALRAFEQERELARKAGDAAQLALAEEGAGATLYVQERYSEALARSRERLALSRSRGDQLGIAYGLLQVGGALLGLGRFPEQRAALAEAGQIANRPGGYAVINGQIELQLAEAALTRRQFASARRRAAPLLAGDVEPTIAIEARRVLALAQLHSGDRGSGRRGCDEALAMARKLAMPHLILRSLLCRAQAALEDGDAAAVLEAARAVQDLAARAGQKESEAQASLLAALAARAAHDPAGAREDARRAEQALSSLQQSWSAEDRVSYESRPDVALWRKQLRSLANP